MLYPAGCQEFDLTYFQRLSYQALHHAKALLADLVLSIQRTDVQPVLVTSDQALDQSPQSSEGRKQ